MAADGQESHVGKPKDLGGGLPLRRRLGKLITKEDPVHLHKTLGILSLVHFAYRYGHVYPRTGELGFSDASAADWMGVALHVALSTSSLIFTVILHRIMDKPTIIWEEYRLHAIVFTLRGFSVYVFHALWPVEVDSSGSTYGSDAQVVALFCLVMAHHIVVDKITEKYGMPNETTVRGDGKRAGPKFKRLMRLYSFYQILALAGHLTVHPKGCDNGWNPMIAVQSSAFCMTLYRKRLIRGKTHAAVYSACLLLSALHIYRINDGYSYFMLKASLVYFLRVQLGCSKYILWSGFSFLLMPSVQQFAGDAYSAVLEGTATKIGLRSVQLMDFDDLSNSSTGVNGTNLEHLGWELGAGLHLPGSAADLPGHDDIKCRLLTAIIAAVAIMRMRRDERHFPKDKAEMKAIDQARRQAKRAKLAAERQSKLGKAD